ncbi:MAG TPA: hypothetical protein VKA84_19950 [Gemmatimonadaceae bacterium]|nr:hypothetical protein [Gemmatimonadaceae bacterium]
MLPLLILAPLAAQLQAAPRPRAPGQLTPVSASRTRGPDSAGAVRAARRAQAAFESYRRWNAPRVPISSESSCDERVGRMCHWYDEPPRPPEPPGISRARDQLIAKLDSFGELLPGDAQLAGLRIWYRIEAGRPREGVEVARRCAADSAWCSALGGLSLHASGEYAAADSAYTAALAAMPEEERCDWTDIETLLEPRLGKRYRKLSCADREGLEARVWWLAQPLHSMGTNDLRTEHLSRAAVARIFRDTRNAHDLHWRDDLEELFLRYGWPTWWSRDPRVLPSLDGDLRVASHTPVPAFLFFPSEHAVQEPLAALPDDWSFLRRHARTRYAPSYAAVLIDSLPHQAAMFRRGDSALVVARYDIRGHPMFRDRALDAALVLSRDEHSRPAIARVRGGGTEILQARVSPGPQLMSLEVRAADTARVARTRYAIRPSDASAVISDILLFEPTPLPPPSLEEALPAMRGSNQLHAGEQVGLLWEVYGMRGAVDVSVTLTRTSAHAGRRVAEMLRLRGKPSAIRLRWEDALSPNHDRRSTGSVMIDVGDRPPGTYELELSVRTADGRTATTSRTVRLMGKDAR